jgi:hypothetical protein
MTCDQGEGCVNKGRRPGVGSAVVWLLQFQSNPKSFRCAIHAIDF